MYEPVPPVPEAVAVPVVAQVALFILVTDALGPAEPVMFTVVLCEQLLASVMVTVYTPAVRPVAV